MNKHEVSRRWFTEVYGKYFKGGWCIKNSHKYNPEYGKLKKKKQKQKKIPSHVFIDTEQVSKMQISLLVFFTDFVDRVGTTTLKMDLFFENFVDSFSDVSSVFWADRYTHRTHKGAIMIRKIFKICVFRSSKNALPGSVCS